MKLQKLFDPIKIGHLQLDNRIYLLGLSLDYTRDFYVNDRYKAFYEERAKGGAGLITIGLAFPSDLRKSPHTTSFSTSIGLWDDSFIPGLKEVAQIIHKNGAKTVCQIGLQYFWQKDADSPGQAIGPSAVSTRRGIEPRELTVDEIMQIIAQHGDASRRAREAGYDGVEFLGGMGYLINRFISSATNKRTDEYGGSLEKRTKFIIDILANAKKKAGADWTYICRISAEEFMEGGHTLEDSKKVAPLLEKAGFDCINVENGWHEAPRPLVQNFIAPGAFAYTAEAIKKVVKIPVAAAYRINDPQLANWILVNGQADLIGMARPLMADPYLPRKAREGRFDDICPCIACNYCMDQLMESKPTACSVNPRCGYETEISIKPASHPRQVVVIGGGPAGMQAAAIAGERGHKVTLIDEGKSLGGLLPLAATVSYKSDIKHYATYLSRRVKAAGVNIKTGEKATPQTVARLEPEVVIVATGSRPAIPEIRGIDRRNVATAVEVLKGEKQTGKTVVIIGSGLVGCETAEFLHEQGKKVTILEMLPRLGPDIGLTVRPFLINRLRQLGIVMEVNAKVVEVTEKGVKAQRDNQDISFEAESVVLCCGMRPNQELADQLKSGKFEVYSIGDCVTPRRIANAASEAAQLACRI